MECNNFVTLSVVGGGHCQAGIVECGRQLPSGSTLR